MPKAAGHKTMETTNTQTVDMVRGTNNEGNYTFMPYSPKAPVTAKDGSRVAKVMYKTNKATGTIAGDNSCLIVAKITEQDVQDNIESLITHVIGMLEGEQDKLVKGFHLDKATFVKPEQLSIASIIEALEAVAVSGRMNKEMIEAWFIECMETPLKALLTAKGYAEDKLTAGCNLYKSNFSKLASNTTQYQPEVAESLIAAIEKCECSLDNPVTGKLVNKLDAMANPTNVVELAAL